jgi:hypothetical protein
VQLYILCKGAHLKRPALFISILVIVSATAFADLEGLFRGGLDHPAIEYSTQTVTDAISALNIRIRNGDTHLEFSDSHGYLESVLKALNIPIESQMLVFSKTSVQAGLIDPTNPRALFYNDSVTVGWVNGGVFLELAAEDPRQGVIFYTLDQRPADKPQFVRRNNCLMCHETYDSLGVPGMIVRSAITDEGGVPRRELGSYTPIDHTSSLEERWGGWYVTGLSGSIAHKGNSFITDPKQPDSVVQARNLDSLKGRFNTDSYLAPYSDIAALMVFDHQMHMTNLFTRVGWESRLALFEERIGDPQVVARNHQQKTVPLLHEAARQLVDYMLFVDEAPLQTKIEGTSGFTEKFSTLGPRDSKGRSLRELDLTKHLMRYPCSYMIYSQAFDALPAEAKDAIYQQMWQVLSGSENGKRYARLSRADRQAVVEILRDTRRDLPAYFSGLVL